MVMAVIDEVSGNQQQVRRARSNATMQLVVRISPRRAQMQVSEMQDAKASQSGRKIGDGQFDEIPLEPLLLKQLQPRTAPIGCRFLRLARDEIEFPNRIKFRHGRGTQKTDRAS